MTTTLFWLRYPFLGSFLALVAWFVYVTYIRSGKSKWM
jgi:hypothetical protein